MNNPTEIQKLIGTTLTQYSGYGKLVKDGLLDLKYATVKLSYSIEGHDFDGCPLLYLSHHSRRLDETLYPKEDTKPTKKESIYSSFLNGLEHLIIKKL